jgi:FKBP-type peptidyl-prolyl cis-trans isomerase FklB
MRKAIKESNQPSPFWTGSRLTLILSLGLFVLPASATDSLAPNTQAAIATQKDKVSYGIGVQLAKTIKGQSIDVNLDLLIKGLQDELSGQTLLMPDEDLNNTMTALQQEMNQKEIQVRAREAEDNKNAGEAFLADNSRKEGIITLQRGLQYKILKASVGNRPRDSDTVTCNYVVTLIDGTEVDKSQVGRPATFQVGTVIPGLREALELMPVGSTWQLFIPPSLAYGERGAGTLEPNTTLIFEVELLSINDKADNP